MSSLFDPESGAGEALMQWWSGLQNHTGDRAELRRCEDVTGVMFVPAFHRLRLSVQPFMKSDHEWQARLAIIAAVVSHIRQVDASQTFARQLAGNSPDQPLVSELRFRRLIERDRDELMVPLVRMLRMLDGSANLYDMSNAVFYWGDNVRRRWCYDYFGSVK